MVWWPQVGTVHFVEAPGTSKRSQITLSRKISLNPGKLVIMSRKSFVRGWEVWIICIRNYELAVFLYEIENYRCRMQRISQSIMLDAITLLQDLQIQKQCPSSSLLHNWNDTTLSYVCTQSYCYNFQIHVGRTEGVSVNNWLQHFHFQCCNSEWEWCWCTCYQ